MTDVRELRLMANTVRQDLIRMLAEAKSGHAGGTIGLADVFTVLYFNALNHDPKNPEWPERDRFILSNGHVAPVRYAVMAETGYFPKEELMTLRKLGTRLQGHPHAADLPGMETSSGSLGQGLSIACGIAWAAKYDKKDFRVYCSIGDGEAQEGQVWEAAMFAAQYKLDNITCFLDRNFLQIDGNTEQVMALDPLKARWESFGWHVIGADGHDVAATVKAFDDAKKTKGKPVIILFKTKMGKCISYMEDCAAWHGKVPNKEEETKALSELEAQRKEI
ncbi:transketolase [Candidatus Micrarchaeota archaeon CG10_big_fil_rev_8_21_14_0_10_59_7]|nr:MAG: transketolase [Candidatus Micrarchaeota archaeon CG10_big_fil_rev_8_21_14_0_10_59_7]